MVRAGGCQYCSLIRLASIKKGSNLTSLCELTHIDSVMAKSGIEPVLPFEDLYRPFLLQPHCSFQTWLRPSPSAQQRLLIFCSQTFQLLGLINNSCTPTMALSMSNPPTGLTIMIFSTRKLSSLLKNTLIVSDSMIGHRIQRFIVLFQVSWVVLFFPTVPEVFNAFDFTS